MVRYIYKALLRGPKFRGRHRLENVLRRLLLPSTDVVADGLRMELDPQEWLQIHLLAGEPLEPKTVELYRRLLRRGDTYIDVGAHAGFHALVAGRCVGPGGRVIALEPQPYNCEKVLTNSQLNGLSNILVVTAAAGAEDGLIILHDQKRDDRARLTLAGDGVSDVGAYFEVPLMRIDTVCVRHSINSIRLLKIDVEGYEREVVAGAQGSLGVIDNVIFECLPETDPDVMWDIVQRLSREGFTLRQIDGSAWVPGVPPIEHNVWASRDRVILHEPLGEGEEVSGIRS